MRNSHELYGTIFFLINFWMWINLNEKSSENVCKYCGSDLLRKIEFSEFYKCEECNKFLEKEEITKRWD